jgi:L-lactate dehydrogenase (cytochrome)
VDRAAEILSAEVRRTMQLLGVRSINELGPHHVELP